MSTEDNDGILVIGAGSTGASIAYHLASMKEKVTVIEKDGIANGNTGKSSALIRTHYSNKMITEMSLYSLRFFEKFDSIGYSGFTKTGMIFPFDEKNASVAKNNVKMLQSLGVNEIEIDPYSIKNYFGDVSLEGYDYVTYEPDSGYADPVATTNSFLSKAKELGAKLLTGNGVRTIDSTEKGVTIELDSGVIIKGKKIVIAANVWTNDILMNSGVSKDKLLPIYATMHSIVYLRRPKEYAGEKPTLWDPHNLAYYKMEGSSITAVGSLDPEVDKKKIDIHQNLPETADEYYVEKYLEKITSRLPAMGNGTIISTLNGLYDMSPDGQVICDNLSNTGLDSVYVIAGLSGHGFKLCPAYGKMVSDMVTERDPETSLFDWRPFYAKRFEENKLIQSQYSEIGTIY